MRLSEEAKRVSELKLASATGKLPYGTLALGSEGIKEAITNFDEARKVDIENERVSPSDPVQRRNDACVVLPWRRD